MIEPTEAHREKLEGQLLAAYDQLHLDIKGNQARRRARARWAPLAAIAVVLIGIFAASRAPADYGVDLGQSIEVRTGPNDGLPEGPELAELIQSGLRPELGGERQVAVRLLRDGQGNRVLRLDVWGAPIEGVAERLRARVPALAHADLSAHVIAGRVHTNLAGLLDHQFLHRHDAASIEEARRALQAQLANEGDDGKVELDVQDGPDGKTRVHVRVESVKKELAPAP